MAAKLDRIPDGKLPSYSDFMESGDMSPTARALRTLELLRAMPGITSRRLAERLGITDRAVRRYIAILREAGVDIESTAGPYGGYRLGRGLRLPPLVFTASEAVSLVMAVLDGHHAAADPDEPVGSSVGKLIAALPPSVQRSARAMREHALAAPDRRAIRPDPLFATILVDAIAEQRHVRITYIDASGTGWQGDVDPWAIVVRHARWYLLGFIGDAGPRTFRVDRIQDVAPLTRPAVPPPDLDPIAWFEQQLGVGWKYPTHVVFEAPLADVAPHITPPMGRLEATDEGGHCVLIGTTSSPDMYAGEWLASIPIPFHVVGGPELREAVAAVGQRMIEAAAGAPTRGSPGPPAG